ncbi:MAG: helicase C-terminal domain-containing protein [Acidobacteriota bacterium]
MPARFDDAHRTLELSVADLLERDLGKSLGFAQRGGFERLWVGQAIHSRYQERAMEEDGSYRREVTVRHELVHKGWTVKMHGRLDGLRRDPDGVPTVEEIKSVRPGTQLSPTVADLYHRQAALYAWMLGESTGEPVRAELVLIEIGAFDDSGIDRIYVDVESRAIEAAVKQRAGGLILEREARAAERERRRLGAAELRFPYHETRPGQQKIIDGVRQALEQKEHLLVEAPTGIGKTVSALFPVLRYALANDKRIFVLTAKTLQQRMATQVLSLLNSESLFHSLQLRAKGKMCANGEVLCHEEYCSYAKEYFLKLQKSRLVDELLDRHPDLEPDAIFAASKQEVVCPFEVSLELERRAQATVCDYNYAFDPYVSLTGFREDSDLRDVILVIDEIHNLVDRGRGYYSPELDSQDMRRVSDAIKDMLATSSASLLLQMAEVVDGLAGLVEDLVGDAVPPGQYGAVEASFPEEQLWPLRTEFDRLFVKYLEHRRETKSFRPEDPFVGLYFDLLRFMNTLQLTHHDSALFSTLAVAERSGRCALQILCKDAGKYLGAVINRTHATIGLSATLSPTEFYRDLLGFDAERTSDLTVGNPFPEENRRIVIDGSVGTTYKERDKNYQPLAERLAEFAEAVPGNCLALFPSYRFLAEVYDRLPELPGRRVLVQSRADGDAERDKILEVLQSALFGDVLLLAVAGGVFAEGVDYPGDMLRAVAVVGPCLPAVTLEQKLLEAHFNERWERGFEYAFVVPGMTRVVQAAGRLIRSPQDRGVIALFDRRFLGGLYKKHLPDDWAGEDGEFEPGHPATVARAFFAEPVALLDDADEATGS